nr:hypothetical protein [Tanacetum cinerariifolium]
EEDIPITAFQTRYGHFKFQVMPFGSTNAPTNKEDHEEHLKTILELFKNEKLYAKFSKCDFWIESVHFLGHVIDRDGVHVDHAKVEAIRIWYAPTTPTEVRQFLGLAGYYQRFIESFSLISKPLSKLTQKNKNYEWGMEEEEARWIELLSDYDCEIRYHPGKGNVVADALSRKDREPLRVRSLVMTVHTNLPEKILEAQTEAIKEENVKAENLGRLLKPIFEIYSNGIRYFKGRLWLPLFGGIKDMVMHESHKSMYSIHPGSDKMYQDLKKLYWWPDMKADIATFVNRLTKSAHFLPMKKTYSIEKLAQLYLKEIVYRHGVPVSIISDRDSLFTSRFWETLQKALGTQLNLSTAYHPETDGQSERMIQTLEDMLRGKPQKDDKGFINSGCSRHMIGNIDYLLDFKKFDSGYVTFRGGAHGGRISGKAKDETSEILKNFIKEIENLVDKKVEIIRCDNRTKFKNKVMDDFCKEKGIKREYSVARTPWQNGVAERRNRTLIEAARTMLADSKLPTTLWAEAVSTACYGQNRVLIVKPHNKTPYELFRGFKPDLSFMRLFGCHVTILNTLDNLGKFDGKSDEGFFVGHSFSSKAFRVYNTRIRKVEENLHIGFLENKPIKEGNGPKWLFDIYSLTQSMNYVPVAAGTISDESAATQGDLNAGTSSGKEATSQDYIVMPIWKDASYFGSPSNDVEDGPHNEDDDKDKSEYDSSPKEVNAAGQHVNTANMFKLGASDTLEATHVEFFSDRDAPKVYLRNIPNSYRVPTTSHTRIHKDHLIKNVIGEVKSSVQTRRMTKPTSKKGFLSVVYEEKTHVTLNTCLYACFLSQIEPTSIAKALSDSSNKARLFAQGHRQEEVIDYEEVFAPVARIKVVKAFYKLHQAPRAWYKTLANYLLSNGFQRGKIDPTLFIKKQKGDILLVHIYVDDIIFGSINKELCSAFEKLMKDKFQMSSMGELTFFVGLQVTQKEDEIFISQDKYVNEILKKFNYSYVKPDSTPVDLEKPLVKDGDANNILSYTKDIPSLSSQYRKSITGGCQFLGNRLISWQCKKQTVVTTSTTEVEYVANASCCRQFWESASSITYENREIKITATIDGRVKSVTEASIRRHLKLEDSEGISNLPNTKIFEQLALMGASKGYSGGDVPLFPTMLVQGPIHQNDPIISPPPISSPSRVSTPLHDSTLPGGNTPGSEVGRMTLNELTVLCTSLSKKVESLESNLKQIKLTYGAIYSKLIMKVKKLENKVKSSKARRRFRLTVSEDEDDLEDPFKQGRKIARNDKDKGITLVQIGALTQGRNEYKVESDFDFTTAEDISTANVPVTTTGAEISTGIPEDKTANTSNDSDDITLAETLIEIKRSATKPQKLEEATIVVLTEEFDEIQDRMDADHELAARLTYEEQEHFTIKEKEKLLAEFFERRKKQLAAERSEAIKNKPPTRTQKLYQKEQKWSYDFKPMDDDSQQQVEISKKRQREVSDEESFKKQKLEEDNDAKKEELRAFWIYEMLDDFQRQDVIDLHRLVQERYDTTEKTYPLTQEVLSRMLNKRLEVDHESEMAFELLSPFNGGNYQQCTNVSFGDEFVHYPDSIQMMKLLIFPTHLHNLKHLRLTNFIILVIKSSVEDLVSIPSESEDTSRSDSECDLPSYDDFSPINIPEGKSVTFSNPLFDLNDNFSSSDDESLSDEDVPEDNVKIYSNPLFEFDDEYISSDINPLFDEVLENIERKVSYDSNLDEPDLLVTPLFDANENECFNRGDDIDEIELLLHRDPSTPKMSVAFILEGLTNEPPFEENGDLFDLESKENEWKKILYDAPVNDLMTEDKDFDLEIHENIFSPTYSGDTIFDPDIFAFHLVPVASHHSGTFMCFNVYPNILNESLMEICSSTNFVPKITMIWGESS